jgi:hypothetical protein
MYLTPWLKERLTHQAIAAAGTEAVCLELKRLGEEVEFRPLVHIRPDNSNAETRAAAIRAFREICIPCARQRKDGAIEIASGETDQDPQFCLVTLLPNSKNALWVHAVITRCRDIQIAQERLFSMQKALLPSQVKHPFKCKVCGQAATVHVIQAQYLQEEKAVQIDLCETHAVQSIGRGGRDLNLPES